VWTVVGDDAAPIEPVERYLAFLTDVARSPNTVRAYAHDLKDWFAFLAGRSMDWRKVRLEDVGEFRRLASAAAGGPRWAGGCPAVGRRSLHRVDGQPQVVGGVGLLPALGAQRCRAGGSAADLATSRPSWRQQLATVPASRQQGPAGGAAGDPVEGPAQASSGSCSG
jgi:hypothetical protein